MQKRGIIADSELGHSVLFSFSTEHLKNKDKVRFFYAFKGRNQQQGIAQRCQVDHLGRGVILVPQAHAGHVDGFLEYWKCRKTKREVWVK